jgi:hypothetical protein
MDLMQKDDRFQGYSVQRILHGHWPNKKDTVTS